MTIRGAFQSVNYLGLAISPSRNYNAATGSPRGKADIAMTNKNPGAKSVPKPPPPKVGGASIPKPSGWTGLRLARQPKGGK